MSPRRAGPGDRYGAVDPASPAVQRKAQAALETLESLGQLVTAGSALDPGWWERVARLTGTLSGQAEATARALRGHPEPE